MLRGDLELLMDFLAVSRERSFTKAAAKLGVSQSLLSQKMRALEQNLGVKLLARTTRSVAPTEAGFRLIESVSGHLQDIETGIATITEMRATPSGTVRISAPTHATNSVIWPRLAPVVQRYPQIKIEINTSNHLVDIVADGYDAGVRLGEQVAKDMVAVRVSPDAELFCVAAPYYFQQTMTPLHPNDLLTLNCINLRLPSSGRIDPWIFQKGSRKLNVRVEGNLVFSQVDHVLDATLRKFGVSLLFSSLAQPHVTNGKLVRVLQDWCPSSPGLYVYYPSRKHMTAAFRIVIDALRLKPHSPAP